MEPLAPRCAPQEGEKGGTYGEGEGQESPKADGNVDIKVDMSLEDGVAKAVLLVVAGIHGFFCCSDMPIFIFSKALLFRLIFVLVVENRTTEGRHTDSHDSVFSLVHCNRKLFGHQEVAAGPVS